MHSKLIPDYKLIAAGKVTYQTSSSESLRPAKRNNNNWTTKEVVNLKANIKNRGYHGVSKRELSILDHLDGRLSLEIDEFDSWTAYWAPCPFRRWCLGFSLIQSFRVRFKGDMNMVNESVDCSNGQAMRKFHTKEFARSVMWERLKQETLEQNF